MTYYVLERSKEAGDLYIEDERFVQETHRNGIAPGLVRKYFERNKAKIKLLGPKKNIKAIPDLHYWSWVPAFSGRALSMLESIGVARSDFYEIHCENIPVEFFLHLPEHSFDYIDVHRSLFRGTVDINPPMPFGLEILVINEAYKNVVPNLFRSGLAGHLQSSSDLIVSSRCRNGWEQEHLHGATFREVEL